MTNKSDHFSGSYETLRRDLASLEQMTKTFSKIFELDIAARAKRVKNQLQKVTDLYFYETWDTSEVITSSLDLSFSKLEYDTSEFAERVSRLDEAIGELNRIYEQFALPQVIVMLVGSLEMHLSAVFVSCLSSKFGLNDRAISRIRSRYNFQNWGDSVDAFRTFLAIELCPPEIDGSEIVALQQERHVIVHQMGIIDERAVRKLNLSPSLIGRRLEIKQSEVIEDIKIVHRIGEHLYHSTEKQAYLP